MALSGLAGLSASSGVLGVPYPLLNFAPTAYAAWAFRRLRSAYTGKAIRVRRSSDNTEQDIGFLGNGLDVPALKTFVGANSGYVSKVYDQTGNGRDMVQATQAKQPKLVDTGTVLTSLHGMPGFKTVYGTAQYLTCAFSLAQPFTYSLVAQRTADINAFDQAEVMLGSDSFSAGMATKNTSGYFEGYSGVDLASTTLVPQTIFTETFVYNGASSKIRANGNQVATGDAGANGIISPLEWGSWATGQAGGSFMHYELIVWNSGLTTAQSQAVERDQSKYHDIRTNGVYDAWGSHWFKTLTGGATYTTISLSAYTGTGLRAAANEYDLNYTVLATNTDPVRNLYVPGSFNDRDSGTTLQGTCNVPASFVLPDASVGTTPNNPTIIRNTDTGRVTYLNACARPSSTGNIWGYQSTPDRTHGGSGLIGGEILQAELTAGYIPHAIAINVWGKDVLSSTGTGFTAPATKADTNYNVGADANFYGGSMPSLVMGSRLAIPPTVSAASIGVTSATGLIVYKALVEYGAFIVDNTAQNTVAWAADAAAAVTLAVSDAELTAMRYALKVVS